MNYKQLRISPEAHSILLDFSKKSKVSLIDAIDKIAMYIIKNRLDYGDLLREKTKESNIENLASRLEFLISVIKDIEINKLGAIVKTLVRIETDTTGIISNMQINEIIEDNNPIDPEPEQNISSSVPVQNTDEDIYKLKVEKETVDLRLNEAVEIFKMIIKDPASTSSGRKKSIREEDFLIIENFVRKCISQ
ncbi:MAG: hypothetical protein ACK5MK_06260 [Dysgonomonas sp.]